MAVVLAADGGGVALRARADTDDGDGRAVETNKSIDALDGDTKKAQESRNRRVASLQTT